MSKERIEIRQLRADEIECRVQIMKEEGCSLLLYKDARADMKILDETFGITGWEREHEMIGNNLYCTVKIWDPEKQQWIKKQDVGTESNTQAEKGQASDSFKRACFNLGIGRELYTAPFIWIKLSAAEVDRRNGRPVLKNGVTFSIKEIEYNDKKEISKLIIVDKNGTIRYSYNTGSHTNNQQANKAPASKQQPNPKPETTQQNQEPGNEIKCSKCQADITTGVAAFSKRQYGKELCMNCQKQE